MVAIEGLAKVKQNLDRACKSIDDVSLKGVRVGALSFERYAKANCPVRTGTLRRSINAMQLTPRMWKIGTNVVYGPYVEKRRGFMEAARSEMSMKFPRLMVQTIRSAKW